MSVEESRKQSLGSFPVFGRSDEDSCGELGRSWDRWVTEIEAYWRKDNQFSFNHIEFVVMSEE